MDIVIYKCFIYYIKVGVSHTLTMAVHHNVIYFPHHSLYFNHKFKRFVIVDTHTYRNVGSFTLFSILSSLPFLLYFAVKNYGNTVYGHTHTADVMTT